MVNFIRELVSGKRKRLVEGEYNLDLSYITPNLIAMSYPALHLNSIWRNSARQVAQYLNAKHRDAYMIFNLTNSSYDASIFNYQVHDVGFVDHHTPPLNRFFLAIKSAIKWLRASPLNVLLIHCKAGKGRTSMLCVSILLFLQEFTEVDTAIDYFRSKRGGVMTSPSQRQYCCYVAQIIKERRVIKKEDFRLKSIFIHGANAKFLKQLQKKHILINIFQIEDVNGTVRHTLKYSTREHDHNLNEFELSKDDVISFTIHDLTVSGDILVVCKSTHLTNAEKLFRFCFHTGFLKNGVLRVQKKEMDHACKNPSVPSNFKVDMMFKRVETEPSDENNNDGNSVIDVSSIRKVDEDSLLSHLFLNDLPSSEEKFACADFTVDHCDSERPIRITLRPTLERIFLNHKKTSIRRHSSIHLGKQVVSFPSNESNRKSIRPLPNLVPKSLNSASNKQEWEDMMKNYAHISE